MKKFAIFITVLIGCTYIVSAEFMQNCAEKGGTTYMSKTVNDPDDKTLLKETRECKDINGKLIYSETDSKPNVFGPNVQIQSYKYRTVISNIFSNSENKMKTPAIETFD